jgi:tetratricopeptide (TPR) repeat protein
MKKAENFYKEGLKKNLDKKYEEAMADYTKAIDLEPNHVNAYMQRGTLGYRILKQYKGSLMDFDKAVQLAPERADTYLHRGIIKCHLLQFEDGLKDFNTTAALAPNDERVYFNRGKVKYVLKFEKDEVCDDLNRALRLGYAQAAELIKLFYSKDQDAVSEQIEKGIIQKANQ